jgi:hypothetical protein
MITATEARTSSVMHRMSRIEDCIYVACRNGSLSTNVNLLLTHKERVKLNGLGYLITPLEDRTEVSWENANIIEWEDK